MSNGGEGTGKEILRVLDSLLQVSSTPKRGVSYKSRAPQNGSKKGQQVPQFFFQEESSFSNRLSVY